MQPESSLDKAALARSILQNDITCASCSISIDACSFDARLYLLPACSYIYSLSFHLYLSLSAILPKPTNHRFTFRVRKSYMFIRVSTRKVTKPLVSDFPKIRTRATEMKVRSHRNTKDFQNDGLWKSISNLKNKFMVIFLNIIYRYLKFIPVFRNKNIKFFYEQIYCRETDWNSRIILCLS